MLHELRIENLLLLDRAELRLAPGLNALTGETGAGKTLLAHALDLLLGGRARAGIVRAGASEAYVEGVFSPPAGFAGHELIPDDADEIVLARRVWPDGRTRAYLCGRSATVADLRELGGRMLAFYGQHEHRRLMLAKAQLEILDAHCGADHLALRARVGDLYERVRELEGRATGLRELAGARERELDLLGFELDEIESVRPTEEEEGELLSERERLRHVETLRAAAAFAAEAITPEAGGGAGDMLAQAARQMETAASVDPQLHALYERLQSLLYEAQDLGGELRAYELGVEGSPGRLEDVEERLAQFARLERKHGGSIADVLGHAAECRLRRDELVHADVALEAAETELEAARAELDRVAGELSDNRRRAAPRLATAVRQRLGELAMADARFAVEVRPRPDGCGPRGADSVELLIGSNAGVPVGPLREIASGGELSRVMLALLSVAHGPRRGAGARRAGRGQDGRGQDGGGQDGGVQDGRGQDGRGQDGGGQDSGGQDGALLVFDEIDAGIGGHTARAVGRQLRALAAGRQVLCITHLPQVAALAERHFTIVKDAATRPATTTVSELEGEAVVGELVRMLGAGADDRAASQHARQLLRAA